MSKPITPREAKIASINDIPSFVIDVFNKLITKNLQGRYCTIKQDDIVNAIMDHRKVGVINSSFSKQDIFDLHWLDVESLYKKAGWKVTYDKPSYHDDYPATFSFIAPEGFDDCIDISA